VRLGELIKNKEVVDSASGAGRTLERLDEMAGQASRIASSSTAQRIILEPAKKIAVTYNLQHADSPALCDAEGGRLNMPAEKRAAPPVIDFDPTTDSACWHLLAFQMSPYDQERRQQFKAMIGADRLARTPGHVQECLRNPLLRLNPATALSEYQQRIYREFLAPADAWAAVRDSPSMAEWQEQADAMRKSPTVAAGRVLLFVARMNKHHPGTPASIARAIAALKVWAEPSGDIPSARALTQMWQQHGGVAPLYGAVQIGIDAWGIESDEHCFGFTAAGGVRQILAWAAWLRDFATTHVPHGGSRPLLEAGRAIVLPPEIAPQEPSLPPLPAALRQAAREYQSA
jgi:hypothetical protein